MRVNIPRAPARRVSIVSHTHGQEPIRLHKLSQVFKNRFIRMCTHGI